MTKTKCKVEGRVCGNFAIGDGDFCRWHDPDREPKPRRDLLGNAQRALLLEDSLCAVRRIALGHSDPLALCQLVLSRFEKVKS